MEQKNALQLGFLSKRCCDCGCRLRGRQSNVEYVPPFLPDGWIIVGHKAQQAHLFRKFSEPCGLRNARCTNDPRDPSFPANELAFQIGDIIRSEIFLLKKEVRGGRQQRAERLIRG